MRETVEITSRDNSRLKHARRVRDGKLRDTIFVEGLRLIEEAVRSNVTIDCLFVSREGRARASELIERSCAREIHQLSDSAFQSICDTVTSQGLVALAKRPGSSKSGIEERLSRSTTPSAEAAAETKGGVRRSTTPSPEAGATPPQSRRGEGDATTPSPEAGATPPQSRRGEGDGTTPSPEAGAAPPQGGTADEERATSSAGAAAKYPRSRRGDHTAPVPVVIFLYQTNNPSNLGAVIRTAEAAGAAGVIVSTGAADPFSPKALRAAMGSSFRLPVWSDVEAGEALSWAAEKNLRTAATAATGSAPYNAIDWTTPRMVLLGSEAHGLPDAEMQQVDERILIPMEDPVESLNLAVACGVILFEARRQNLLI